MGKQLTQEECMKRCRESQPEKGYDYSKVVYRGAKNKITIICPVHGEFNQVPHDHWRGIGCDKCGHGVYSWEVYKEKARTKHAGRYKYPEQAWKETRDRITIMCEKHGEFTQVSSIHLLGQGCWDCAKEAQRKALSEVLAEFEKTHGDYYDYSLVEYTGKGDKVKIICPVHGVFKQRAEDHGRGRGCWDCNPAPGRLCVKNIEKDKEKYKGTSGHLYLLKCTLGEESFFKIGITGDEVKYRYGTKMKMPYDYIIVQDNPMSLYDAFYIEQEIKEELKDFRHYPEVWFGGHTEAIKIEAFPHIEKILEEKLKTEK